jgi:large subunit ribosomal protein L18
MSRIFVSYSVSDQPDASEVLEKWLEQRNEAFEIQDPSVWASAHHDVRNVIRERIQASDSFVVVWTERAAESPWVLYEMGMAHALGVPITVLLAGGEPAAIPDEITEARVVELERYRPRLEAGANHLFRTPVEHTIAAGGKAVLGRRFSEQRSGGEKVAKRIAARKLIRERIRQKFAGTTERPRLTVFRSLKSIYAQVIDDASGKTIVSASSLEKDAIMKGTNAAAAKAVGELIAKKARDKGITRVVFDRGGYLYNGKVKALADAARENGLEF